jgi:hypothetical protein
MKLQKPLLITVLGVALTAGAAAMNTATMIEVEGEAAKY